MRNIGLMVITMISPKTEKNKTQKQVMPVVIMAARQQQQAVMKMVRVQTVVSQKQQLANVQAVNGMAH